MGKVSADFGVTLAIPINQALAVAVLDDDAGRPPSARGIGRECVTEHIAPAIVIDQWAILRAPSGRADNSLFHVAQAVLAEI